MLDIWYPIQKIKPSNYGICECFHPAKVQTNYHPDDAHVTIIAGTIDGTRCQKNVNIWRFSKISAISSMCQNVTRECFIWYVFIFFSHSIAVYTDTVTLSDDASIMTYRGHRVKKTLIRAKFSPQETTGQRYIYTGCGTGRLISTYSGNTTLYSMDFLNSFSFLSLQFMMY